MNYATCFGQDSKKLLLICMGICLVLGIANEFSSVFTGANDRMDDIMYGKHDPNRHTGFGLKNIIKIAVIVTLYLFFMWCVYQEIKCCLIYLFVLQLLVVLTYVFLTAFIFYVLINNIVKGYSGTWGLVLVATISVAYTIFFVAVAVLLYKVLSNAVARTEEVGMSQVPK
ncbi:hypothetical protein WR25_17291 [Diploscapter pachys]|uniref:Uncharacterized protein n=1 Tax=Diploscapter pachys TaxID=2018661 RepID=A0A2A2KRT0_9BILA|nr:hypothetical protein WR25_17291 [Diploscapter pachys]